MIERFLKSIQGAARKGLVGPARVAACLGILALSLALTAATASAGTISVDNNGACVSGTGNPPYSTTYCAISDAVTDAASGDTINVAAGTYVEAVVVNKPLTLLGATAGVSKNGYAVPPDYAWDDALETVIKHPNPTVAYNAIVDIEDTDDVTLDGFIIEELDAVGNLNTSLVRVYAHTREISNIRVVNNVIGPNTNTTTQDGGQGRMGLYIVNHPYSGDFGVVDSTFADNKIFDAQGNGNNIFIWSSYFAYGAPYPASMSGTVIEDNEIYGSRRSGLESAGGFADLTIRHNTIYNNASTNGGPYDAKLKYGHGILMIRGASDKLGDSANAYGPVNLTIVNNDIYGNEKSGIYLGPKNSGYTIACNKIHDNGWNGLLLDLEARHWNGTFEPPPDPADKYAIYDGSDDIAMHNNIITGNGTAAVAGNDYGVQVNGTPTNAFVLDAADNWWGCAAGPGNPGCGTVAGSVDASSPLAAEPLCASLCDTALDLYVDTAGSDADNFCAESAAPCASIQHAVDVACLPGDTVHVAAGTYAEQVRIGKSLTVSGAGAAVTTIVAPGVLSGDKEVVSIAGDGVDVELTGLTVSGPGPSGCASIYFGILVRDGANADIHDNAIVDIRDDPFSGCQNAVAIQVGRDYWATSGTATITDNLVTGYQKNGITVDGAGSDATISGNVITGAGPTTVTAQNGVQISRGATATVENNVISDNDYTPASWCSTGVLVYASDGVLVRGNTLSGSLCDLLIQANDCVIEGNSIPAAMPWSFSLLGDGNVVDGNYVNGSSDAGVYVDGIDNTLTCNRITGNAVGIYFDSYSTAGTPNAANQNVIAGNTAGLDASAVSALPLVDATNNYWGCAAGANSPGCDTAVGNADVTPPASAEPLCVTCAGAGGDADDDSVCDSVDNCAAVANADQADADSDGVGDLCDDCPLDDANDADSDGVCGDVDNCPDDANADQSDIDEDGIGDVCDLDEAPGTLEIGKLLVKPHKAGRSRLVGKITLGALIADSTTGGMLAEDLLVNDDVVFEIAAGSSHAVIAIQSCEQATQRQIKCKSDTVKATFTLLRPGNGGVTPDTYKVKVNYKEFDDTDEPTAPVTVVLHQPTQALDRSDGINNCRSVGSTLSCKE